jgi:hypothetical protein
MTITVDLSDIALTQKSANEVVSKSNQDINFLVRSTQSVSHVRIVSASSKEEARKLFLDEIVFDEDFVEEADVDIESITEINSN